MPVLDTVERLLIARFALGFATFFAGIVVWGCSLRFNRRQYDPARFAFLLQRIFMGFFLFACLLDAVGFLLVSLQTSFGLFSSPNAGFIIYTAASFFMMLTESLIFAMLIHLLNGVSISQLGSLSDTGKALNPISTTLAVLLGILSLAIFALELVRHYIGSSSWSFYPWAISVSFRGLDMLASTILVARSIRVMAISREEGRLAKASILALACCALALTRSIYGLASVVGTRSTFWIYLHVLVYVFEAWPNLLIFCITFVIGRDRQDGLWSLHQPPPAPISRELQQPALADTDNLQLQPGGHYDPQTGQMWQSMGGYNQPQEQYRYYPQESLIQGMYATRPDLYTTTPELPPTELQPPVPLGRSQRSPSPILLPNTPASGNSIPSSQLSPIPGFLRR
ncbi:unnamed protein product [Clonostachys rosea]|uniref:THH1/TOM1/TOM3 domain-containing protein n=1 Tax=Bionectria ochroleuca TaxID=29856 RepID=A0ABY6U5F2_BIOOC|nr:unnamed protein product [Clonostachys rosea]